MESILQKHSDFEFLYNNDLTPHLPCNPQHLDSRPLAELMPNINRLDSFAIVRHPILRAISEHGYQNRLNTRRGLKTKTFNQHVSQWLYEYRFSPYIFDNHIRPQVDFLFSKTRIFRIENGIENVIEYAFTKLGGQPEQFTQYHSAIKKKSKVIDFNVRGEDVIKLQNFYSPDFDLLGYKKLDISRKDDISFFDLKSIALSEPTSPIRFLSSETLEHYNNSKRSTYTSAFLKQSARAMRAIAKIICLPYK